MTERIKRLREWIELSDLSGMQTFNTHNTVGDKMLIIYCEGELTVLICTTYNYLEILGATEEEYLSLSDILMCC